MLGLGVVGVVGAFDVPLDHLAFDDSWCGSFSSGRVEAREDPFLEGRPQAVGEGWVVRGKNRPGGRWSGG